MALRRWNCFCGATGNAGQFCQWCGRRDPGVEPPPLPPPVDAEPAFQPLAPPSFAPPSAPESESETVGPPPPSYLRWGGDPLRPPDQSPRVGITPVTRLIGTVLVVLLGVGVLTADRRVDERDLTAIRSPDGRTLKTAIEDAKRFIEGYRGAPFLRGVDVELLAGERFEEELLEGEGDDPDADAAEEGEDFEATLQGLRLADPGEDVGEAEEDLLTDTVVGFYDDEAKRLVVRGGTLDASAEMTLVHELAHAWQDQHYDLGDMWDEVDNQDEALALRSLIEGDASRTETAWYDAQPEEVQERIDDAEEYLGDDSPAESGARGSLSALYGFPYSVGERFADAIARDGGNDALAEAFGNPPVSSAQILFPQKYLEGDIPEDAVDPKPGGRVVDRGRLGVAALILTVGFDEVPFSVYSAWAGDEYVTWESDGRTCTTVSVVMEASPDRDELVEAIEDIELGTGGGVTPNDDGFVFVSCES